MKFLAVFLSFFFLILTYHTVIVVSKALIINENLQEFMLDLFLSSILIGLVSMAGICVCIILKKSFFGK
jgi:hypothetical protein